MLKESFFSKRMNLSICKNSGPEISQNTGCDFILPDCNVMAMHPYGLAMAAESVILYKNVVIRIVRKASYSYGRSFHDVVSYNDIALQLSVRLKVQVGPAQTTPETPDLVSFEY